MTTPEFIGNSTAALCVVSTDHNDPFQMPVEDHFFRMSLFRTDARSDNFPALGTNMKAVTEAPFTLPMKCWCLSVEVLYRQQTHQRGGPNRPKDFLFLEAGSKA